ncbi:MAG: FecR domain-containing protein, partial [Candidatus Udaeobacter sp.]
MKKLSVGLPHPKFIAAASAFVWTIAIANSASAAQLEEARVTQVVNDVKLLLQQAAPRAAVVSDLVRKGAAVRTGTQSRSELTFADLTITRLGANTIFSFNEGTREMNLIDGAILFQVPKGSGGATIRTVGVTAAITGTTGIGEFHPATAKRPQPFSKWLCLEGTFHLYLPNGQSVEVGPGKMVTTDGKSFSKVLTFDIAKLTSTSLFFTGFDQPLASMNLITLESQNQLASSLLATTTTNPLDPTRIVNVTSQAVVAEEAQAPPSSSVSPPPPTAPPPTPPPPTPPPPTPPVTPTPPISPTPPPPTPSKFGTP